MLETWEFLKQDYITVYKQTLITFKWKFEFKQKQTNYCKNMIKYLDRVKRIWYLSPMRAAKVQASLRIRAVSPEPPLLAHTRNTSQEEPSDRKPDP